MGVACEASNLTIVRMIHSTPGLDGMDWPCQKEHELQGVTDIINRMIVLSIALLSESFCAVAVSAAI